MNKIKNGAGARERKKDIQEELTVMQKKAVGLIISKMLDKMLLSPDMNNELTLLRFIKMAEVLKIITTEEYKQFLGKLNGKKQFEKYLIISDFAMEVLIKAVKADYLTEKIIEIGFFEPQVVVEDVVPDR